MKPLSRKFLLSRGYCCGNGCLNCPYKKHLNMETPIQKLFNALENPHTQLIKILEDKHKYIEEEKQLISDAMMYAFDEDGHTGTWKQKVINKYYNEKFNHSTKNAPTNAEGEE
jgi:hypothetical protein